MTKEDVTPAKYAKCTKHDNCRLIDGAHAMTIYADLTSIDFRKGTVTRKRYTAKEIEDALND